MTSTVFITYYGTIYSIIHVTVMWSIKVNILSPLKYTVRILGVIISNRRLCCFSYRFFENLHFNSLWCVGGIKINSAITRSNIRKSPWQAISIISTLLMPYIYTCNVIIRYIWNSSSTHFFYGKHKKKLTPY